MVHLWLTGKRVVDFLLVLTELFSPPLTVEVLWVDVGRNCVWKEGVTFSANFRGKGSFINEFWRQKTRVPGLSRGVVCVILRLAVLIQYRCVTDRQTQRHMITA